MSTWVLRQPTQRFAGLGSMAVPHSQQRIFPSSLVSWEAGKASISAGLTALQSKHSEWNLIGWTEEAGFVDNHSEVTLHHLWLWFGYENSVTTRGLWRDHKANAALHSLRCCTGWHTMMLLLVQFKKDIKSFHTGCFFQLPPPLKFLRASW